MKEIENFIKKNNEYSIKFSFGKYSDAFLFDENLFQLESYSKIKNKLDSCKTWDDKYSEYLEEYADDIEIKDFIVFTYKNSVYDIRIIAYVSTEKFVSKEYTRENHIFRRKNHEFCICKEDDSYFFDLKILNNKDYKYTAESSVLKIKDVLNFIEKNNEIQYRIIS